MSSQSLFSCPSSNPTYSRFEPTIVPFPGPDMKSPPISALSPVEVIVDMQIVLPHEELALFEAPPKQFDTCCQANDSEFAFDDVARSVTKNGNTVYLSKVHYRLMQFIFLHRHETITLEMLAARCWPDKTYKPKSAGDEARRLSGKIYGTLGIRIYSKDQRLILSGF
jgi:hypothetical protein